MITKREYNIIVKNKKAEKRLAVLCMMPENPRFAVELLHGVNERYTRYYELMEYIAGHGGAAVMFDGRGHGLTAYPDELGFPGEYYSSDETLFFDIDAAYCSAFSSGTKFEFGDELFFPAIPRFLFGFSMGAMQASLYMGRYSDALSGCILAGLPKHEPLIPPVYLGLRLYALITGDGYFSPWLNRLALTRYSRGFDPEPDSDGSYLWLSRDLGNRAAFASDPLCCHDNPTILYEYLMRLVRDTYRPSSYGAKNRNMPLLLMAGEDDPVSGGDGGALWAEKFYSDVGYRRVKSVMYKSMRHEIFYDWGKEYPMGDLLAFIEDSLGDTENGLRDKKPEYESCFTEK